MARAIESPVTLPAHRAYATGRQVIAVRRAGFVVEWVSFATLADSIDEWRGLVGRTLAPNVFLEPAFAIPAARVEPDLGAVSVRDGSRMLGLFPGRVQGIAAGRPVPTFVAWTHPYAPLSTPLIDREAAAAVVEVFLEAVPFLPGEPKLALFPLMDERSGVGRMIEDALIRTGRRPHTLASHLRAALHPGVSEPLGFPSSKRLKELRRQRRRLGELGKITRETSTHAAGVSEVVREYLALEAKGWKGRLGTAALMHEANARFVEDAVTGLAAEGKSRVDLLKLDDRTIAATITLFSGDRAWFWKIAYDEEFARFSPGVQLAVDLTEALGRYRCLSLVDSCAVAEHPMIDQLWKDRLRIVDWMIPFGERLSFAAGVAGERAWRALRSPLRAVRRRIRR